MTDDQHYYLEAIKGQRSVAQAIVVDILADLTGRHTIKWGFEELDDDVEIEILQTLTKIVYSHVLPLIDRMLLPRGPRI